MLSVDTIFYGITHLGFFPGTGQVLLYDHRHYSILERLIGAGIADLTRYAVAQSSIRPRGYTLTITLQPEAIGFSGRHGTHQLRFMIDVVDVDDRGRQETVLSTSSHRRWGDPATFTQLDLYPPLRVDLHPDFPEAGNPRARRYDDDLHPVNYLPLDFLYTKAGWVPVERITDPFYAYDQPAGFTLENVLKLSFRRATLQYRMEMRGRDTLEFLTTSTGEYCFVGRRFVRQTKDTLATFLLSDSSVAILSSTCESTGTFTQSFSSSLILAAGSSETILGELWNGSWLTFTDSLRFEEKQWDQGRMRWDEMYDEKNFDWTGICSWERFGRSMVIDLGNAIRVRISWNDLGGNIAHARL
jgi:hypothetical protein